MLLGNRPRPLIRRTASMSGITLDLKPHQPSDHGLLHIEHGPTPPEHFHLNGVASYDYGNSYLAAMPMDSPRRNPNYGTAAELIEPAQFLRTCGLCQHRLAPGRDIYMYRGESAFCSLECREQQMKKDERKEKRASSVSSGSK